MLFGNLCTRTSEYFRYSCDLPLPESSQIDESVLVLSLHQYHTLIPLATVSVSNHYFHSLAMCYTGSTDRRLHRMQVP